MATVVEATLKKFNVMSVGIVLILAGALMFMVSMMLTQLAQLEGRIAMARQ